MAYDLPEPVPIPADVEQPDKVLAGLTTRQVAIAAVAAVIIWAGWLIARRVMPLPAFAALAAPVGVAATALVLGQRDGLTLDRLLAAAWRQSRAPRRLVTAPEGIPPAPAWAVPHGPQPPLPAALAPLWRHVSADGVIGLGTAGAAAVAAVSTVNFALRSPAEQDALAAAYGRWLNSLTGPAQVLIRAGRADLTGAVAGLREAAPALPHPALEQAALEHAGFLEQLATGRDVLTRQALLVIREPSHGTARAGGTAAARALQRAGEAARLLAAADLQVSVLDGGQVTAVLAACADPGAPPLPAGRLARPGQPVTSPGGPV
jgi:PrgI family protein